MTSTGKGALFNRVALIGIGLIGSSISHAMRRHGLAGSIVGHAQSAATRETALRLGLVSAAYATAAQAVAGADLVILCVPVGACGAVAAEIGPHLANGAIVTDVGSVKGAIVRDVGQHLPEHVHFVPGHPIAGTEYSGPESGFASLFDTVDEIADWYGGGANSYIWGQSLKVRAEFGRIEFDKGSRKDFNTLVTQLQLVF